MKLAELPDLTKEEKNNIIERIKYETAYSVEQKSSRLFLCEIFNILRIEINPLANVFGYASNSLFDKKNNIIGFESKVDKILRLCDGALKENTEESFTDFVVQSFKEFGMRKPLEI